ncbi:MAG TPA: hypothetical protein VGP62_20745 [Bryobacteraceae bacterium]|jgi:hypothetical protein|nr:hypothetical protein [Bryobacteraceae bacterium]
MQSARPFPAACFTLTTDLGSVGDGLTLTLHASLEIKSEQRAFEQYRAQRQERDAGGPLPD